MYDALATEEKWANYWSERKLFQFDNKDTKKRLFVIDSPPPFTSGAMTMGTVLYSLMDAVARYKKMKGYNVLYPQGWDMQGFPTEKAVEREFGKNLPREEFYKKCAELANSNLDKMKVQMKKLGLAFDERYEYKTASPEFHAKVQLSLILMHEKGFVYREKHPVEFCWSCGSAIAHAEINEREEETQLNYLEFKVGTKSSMIIATTRPELLHACVAIAVNPKDERYAKLIDKKATVPVTGASVKIIGDESVDKDFGTGAEMICTFGDKQDVEFYYKYKLKLIEAIDETGHLINSKYNGLDLEQGRAKMLDDLKAAGALKKQETLKHTVRIHDRCETPIEFVSSMQWFIKLKEHVEKIRELCNEVKWTPEFAKQRLFDWADNLGWDWAFSRNRVFGTPIPFWYCNKCGSVFAAAKEKLPVDPARDKAPVAKCTKCGGKLTGESATCDVWIDSSITPLVIAGWPESKEYKKFLPVALRFQGTDIIRTWGFYTIFRVWALTGSKAWEEALVHSMILAQDGRMMHKSWGNVISPDEISAKGYSGDAMRLWSAIGGAIGKDRPFSYNDLEYAKSFIVKLYNTANFVDTAMKNGKVPDKEPREHFNIFDLWMLNKLNSVVKDVTDAYDNYMFYDAMSKAIAFYWHEFADFYIENVKHRVYSNEKKMAGSKAAALFVLRHVLESSLKLFAPIIPFVCEELNSKLNKKSIFEMEFPTFAERRSGTDYVINGFIQRSAVDVDPETAGALLNDVISEVRKQKAKEKVALNKEIASININVPEEYYSAVVDSADELKSICKAQSIKVSKNKDFSVSVQL